jgi:hypothetical protein
VGNTCGSDRFFDFFFRSARRDIWPELELSNYAINTNEQSSLKLARAKKLHETFVKIQSHTRKTFNKSFCNSFYVLCFKPYLTHIVYKNNV